VRQGRSYIMMVDEGTRYSASDVVAVAIYSVLVLLLMLAWAYVPS
jgi:hypothetical protein